MHPLIRKLMDSLPEAVVWPWLVGLTAAAVLIPLTLHLAMAQTGGLSITSGPSVGPVDETTATIRWSTDQLATTVVEYGLAESLGSSQKKIVPGMLDQPESDALEINHSLVLWELRPDTTYYFRVRSVAETGGAAAVSSVSSFKTLAKAAPTVVPLNAVKVTVPEAGSKLTGEIDLEASVDGLAEAVSFQLTGAAQKTFTATTAGSGIWGVKDAALSAGNYSVKATATGKDPSGAAVTKTSDPVSFSVAPPPPVCGDGKCEAGETEAGCPKDCAPKCDKDVWACGEWSVCSAEGKQTRACKMKTDCPTAETPEPAAEQSCTPPTEEKSKVTGEPVPGAEVTLEQEPETAKALMQTETGPAPEAAVKLNEVANVNQPAPVLTPELTSAVQEFQAAAAPPTAAPAPAGGAPQAPSEPAIDPLCKKNDIAPENCDSWLQIRYADRSCLEAGISIRESCDEYLTKKNGGIFPGCAGVSADECGRIKDLTMAAYLPGGAKLRADQVIAKAVQEGVVVSDPKLTALLPQAAAAFGWRESSATGGAETSPAVLIPDADKDGIPDDLQQAISSLEKEKVDVSRDPTAKALLTRRPLGQPRAEGICDASFTAQVTARMFTQLGPYSQSVSNLDDNRIQGGESGGSAGAVTRSAGGPYSHSLSNIDESWIASSAPCSSPSAQAETRSGVVRQSAVSEDIGSARNLIDGTNDNTGLLLPGSDKKDAGLSESGGSGSTTPEERAVRGGFAVSGRSSTLVAPDQGGSGKTDSAAPSARSTRQPVVLSGRCPARSICLIYVNSYVPMVLTTVADANGNWSYDLGNVLTDGQHTVYVAVTDETGKIARKSGPLSLFINEAQAASEADLVKPDINVPIEGPVAVWKRWYIFGAAGLVAIAGAAAWALIVRKPRKIEVE